MEKKLDLITFNTKDGFELNGALNFSEAKNIIIHVHGMTGNFYGGTLTQSILEDINIKGFDVLTINTRGHGVVNRIHGKKKKKVIGTANENFTDSIYDIDGAIKFAKKLGYKNIILSGHSTGCQKVTYYQAKKKNKDVKGIILLSPCDDYALAKKSKNYKKYLRKAKKMISDRKGNDVLAIPNNLFTAKRWLSAHDNTKTEAKVFDYSSNLYYFKKIKCPVFVSFGSKDYFGKGQNAKKLNKILSNNTKADFIETIIINGADHSYKGHIKEIIKKLEEFLKLFN
jgi:alpha-beta hydrolase superfamily lysophospholipase